MFNEVIYPVTTSNVCNICKLKFKEANLILVRNKEWISMKKFNEIHENGFFTDVDYDEVGLEFLKSVNLGISLVNSIRLQRN